MIIIKCIAVIAILFTLATKFKESVTLTLRRTTFAVDNVKSFYQQESLSSQLLWEINSSLKNGKIFIPISKIDWQDKQYNIKINDYHNLLDIWNIKSQESIKLKALYQKDITLQNTAQSFYEELLAYIRQRSFKNYLSQTPIQLAGEVYWLNNMLPFIEKIRAQVSSSDLPLAPVISTSQNNLLPSFFYTDNNLIAKFLGLNEDEKQQIIQLKEKAFASKRIPLQLKSKGPLVELLNLVYDTSSLKIPNDLHLTISTQGSLSYERTEITFPVNFINSAEQNVFYIWEQR